MRWMRLVIANAAEPLVKLKFASYAPAVNAIVVLYCVVENPVDVSSIEQSDFNGLYFVLVGHLSQLDGIGPDEIGLHELGQLFDEGEIQEVILATNTTVVR